MERPAQPEPFLRGCAFGPALGVPYPRAAVEPPGDRLPADTLAVAALPVGVRFEWTGDARAIVVDYETFEDDLGYRGDGAGRSFALYRGVERIDEQPARLGRHRVELAAGDGEGLCSLYLPEGMKPLVHGLVGVGGTMAPPPARPRWLCYGDSIAEGWIASGPSGAWPAIAGRERSLDVVNLGYAGAARGEIVSAEQLSSLSADVLSVSHGTNCWSRTPHSAAMFRAGLEGFFALLRQGHPDTPVVAISPIVRPDAEETPNVLGATLAALRRAFEEVVQARVEGGDRNLSLVEGAPLVDAAQLPDGIHPGDEGHRALARVLGPIVARAAGCL